MHGPLKRSLIVLGTVLAGAVALTVTMTLAQVKPPNKPAPSVPKPAARGRPAARSTSPRKPLLKPLSPRAAQITQGSLIERVVVDDLTPEQLQEVMVTVELKRGVDASKAMVFVAGRPGNPRIVRFYQSGADAVRVVVLAGGKYDSREVAVKVRRPSRLQTTAMLNVKPYAFRANTAEFKVVRAPRGSNLRYTWAFGDGRSAVTDVPWTTHSYPAATVMKTYQASVTFSAQAGGTGERGTVVPGSGGRPPTVRPRGAGRDVTVRETVVRWPRPAGEGTRRTGQTLEGAAAALRGRTGLYGPSLGRGQPQPKPKQVKLRDYAVGYEVYQAMKVLRKQQVTIEDIYRLRQEGTIRPWVRPRARGAAGESAGRVILASYGRPQLAAAGSDEDLDRLAEELYGSGYEFVYVPGRLVNARKGDLYLIERVDVPGVSAIIQTMGQTYTHVGMLAEDQYAIRDMSADGKSPHPHKAGELFRGSETDYSDPSESIPYRLNPILLRQQGPGIRERSVDEAIVGGSLVFDNCVIVKPTPAHEAEDRPRVEAMVEAARRIESSVGLPGVFVNYYKLYAYTDATQIGMCSSYVWSACGDRLNMPLFDYSPALRRILGGVCYDNTRVYLLQKAWEEAGGEVEADMLVALGYLEDFAANAANQIVNTFGWDDSDNLSHDWAKYSDEQFGWCHTVSPDNLQARWFSWDAGREVDGWGRPWGHVEPVEYELGYYRAVKKGGSLSEGPGTRGATVAGRVKLILHKLKCLATEEVTDEVYLRVSFKNKAGRTVQSFGTKVYRNLNDGDDDDPDDGDEVSFTPADRDNVGWVDIGDGLTITATLYEQDNGRGNWLDPDDKLGTKNIDVTRVPMPAGSAVVYGEPPGRRQDDPGTMTFERKSPNPLKSDWKYKVWFQTVYAPAR